MVAIVKDVLPLVRPFDLVNAHNIMKPRMPALPLLTAGAIWYRLQVVVRRRAAKPCPWEATEP